MDSAIAREPKTTLVVSATRNWLRWTDRLAEHEGTTTAAVVETALAKFAEQVGFGEAPPKRSAGYTRPKRRRGW